MSLAQRTGLFLSFAIVFMGTINVLAQSSGLSASPANPEQEKVQCKLGTRWVEIELIHSGQSGFSFSSDKEAQQVVEEVLKAANKLPGVIIAKAARVGNACICRSTKDDYILYNPAWFKNAYRNSAKYWMDRAIIAHELGHFRYNHVLDSEGSLPHLELEADEYAGEVLAKMEAAWDQAKLAYESEGMHDPHGSETHPPTKERLKAVEKGWSKVRARLTAGDHVSRAIEKFNRGDKWGALTEYDKAIELDPMYAGAYVNRAYVKAAIGDSKAAIGDLDKAIALDPKYAGAYVNRAAAKFNTGDKWGALADYNSAIEADPGYAGAYHNRGVVKAALEDRQGEIADYIKAAKLGDKNLQQWLKENGYSWQ